MQKDIKDKNAEKAQEQIYLHITTQETMRNLVSGNNISKQTTNKRKKINIRIEDAINKENKWTPPGKVG